MFLLRSIFWLTVAFMFIRPGGVDLPGSASTLSNAALESGRQVALQTLDGVVCGTIECNGARLLATSALRTSGIAGATSAGQSHSVLPTSVLSPVAGAPIPMPRLARRG